MSNTPKPWSERKTLELRKTAFPTVTEFKKKLVAKVGTHKQGLKNPMADLCEDLTDDDEP
jgi:hypothetical protein